MASLMVVSGKSRGYYFPLEQGTVIVGRDEACDVQVLDEMVSRRHMKVRFDADSRSYRSEDLQSANGVIINGQRISEETVLTDGDTIMIGESKLFFTVKDFLDGESALMHFKHRGERGKSTLIEPPPPGLSAP
ncbi:MAG: FHA domain-containing protein [Planctomycetota bacterium]|jgi:S-DNA-T family DNA segregation ATPase FtsK/SpoIIIE